MAEILAALQLIEARPIRRQIENAIERLIALLDAADGDPDLEPEEDEGADDRPCDDEGLR